MIECNIMIFLNIIYMYIYMYICRNIYIIYVSSKIHYLTKEQHEILSDIIYTITLVLIFPWQHRVLDISTAHIAAYPCFRHDATIMRKGKSMCSGIVNMKKGEKGDN